MAGLIDLNGLGHFKAKENAMVADTYSASKTYAVGDYVYYNGTLYRCTTAISTTEAWTAGHWTAAKLGDDCSALKTQFNYNQFTIYDVTKTFDLGLVVKGTLQPAGNNGGDSAKNTRTMYIRFADSMVAYMDTDVYEWCVWGYPTASGTGRVDAFTNSAYVSANIPVIMRRSPTSNYFRIGFHRKDGANLTTDLTDPTSDFSVITANIKFRGLKESAYDLYPTGDNTDRIGEISLILLSKGICKLAPGDYYVGYRYFDKNIELVGAGKDKTRLISTVTNSVCALKLKENTRISNLTLELYQENGDITPTAQYSQGIHGFAIGNDEASPLINSYNVTLENLNIKNFTGCGVFMNHIGTSSNGAIIKNVKVELCGVGFYFGEYAEYNTVIGCNARFCYYGAIVKGGNNIISSSVFASVETGIGLLNSDDYGTTENDAHGIIDGCKITHTGYYSETDGLSFESEGQASGHLISGCMFSSLVDVKDRGKGLQFSGCQFRGDNAITIDNSVVNVLSSVFQQGSTTGITVLNGGEFIRTGCVDFDGNALASVT